MHTQTVRRWNGNEIDRITKGFAQWTECKPFNARILFFPVVVVVCIFSVSFFLNRFFNSFSWLHFEFNIEIKRRQFWIISFEIHERFRRSYSFKMVFQRNRREHIPMHGLRIKCQFNPFLFSGTIIRCVTDWNGVLFHCSATERERQQTWKKAIGSDHLRTANWDYVIPFFFQDKLENL